MRADRLLVLADFLDKLPEKKFNFAVIASQGGKPMLEALAAGNTDCGTVGCAIGWLPAVFPESFRWLERTSWATSELNIVGFEDAINFDAAAEFFEITTQGADSLFMPGPADEGYSGLSDGASPREVAALIREFVQQSN